MTSKFRLPVMLHFLISIIFQVSGIVNTEIEKIIKILDDNREFLEVWNHGLNHMYENETTEFYSYTKGSISKAYQREHLN